MSQPLEALALANEARSARIDLRRRIKAGDETVSDLMVAPFPRWLEGMPVEQLLTALPGMGTARMSRICQTVPVSPLQRLGYVTLRQRGVIAREVESWEASSAKLIERWRKS